MNAPLFWLLAAVASLVCTGRTERIIEADAGAGGVVGYFTSATSVTLIWMNWPL